MRMTQGKTISDRQKTSQHQHIFLYDVYVRLRSYCEVRVYGKKILTE